MKFVKSMIPLLLALIPMFVVMGTICAQDTIINGYVVTTDPIPGFDGELSASLNETTLHVGDTVALTIHPQNYGESDWENILIYAPIPKGFEYVSHVVPDRTMQDYNPATGIWNVQQMLHGGRGADKELIITLKVLPGAVGTHVIFSTYGVKFISLISVYPNGVNSNPKYYNVVASQQAPGNPRDIVVNVAHSPLIADFTATPTTGTAPLIVQFTDTSTGDPTSWKWDFGDGSTSTQQNPVHNYTKQGKYTVKLTITNPTGNDSKPKTDYITVNDFGIPGITNLGKNGTGGGDSGVGNSGIGFINALKNLQKGGGGGENGKEYEVSPAQVPDQLAWYMLAILLIVSLLAAGYFYEIRRKQ